MEYHVAKGNIEIMPFATTKMELENIMSDIKWKLIDTDNSRIVTRMKGMGIKVAKYVVMKMV